MSEEQPSQRVPLLQQPDLLPGVPSAPLFTLENKGEFTGERLHRCRPDTYKAVCVLLAQGLGVIKIGELLGVSSNTVMAVRDREKTAVDQIKGHLAKVALSAATLASEGILEQLNTIVSNPLLRSGLGVKELKELAVVYGIMVQNAQLLSGAATARIEIAEAAPPAHEDFNAYLATLKTAGSTHLEGETPAPKGPGATRPAAPAGPGPASAEAPLAAAPVVDLVPDPAGAQTLKTDS
jgi:hypothetical protein